MTALVTAAFESFDAALVAALATLAPAIETLDRAAAALV